MAERVQIIPFLHGKVSLDGKLIDPDIYWILEKWLERHPQVKDRRQDIRISRGQFRLPCGVMTDLIDATIIAGDDIAGLDTDLYERYVAEV